MGFLVLRALGIGRLHVEAEGCYTHHIILGWAHYLYQHVHIIGECNVTARAFIWVDHSKRLFFGGNRDWRSSRDLTSLGCA